MNCDIHACFRLVLGCCWRWGGRATRTEATEPEEATELGVEGEGEAAEALRRGPGTAAGGGQRNMWWWRRLALLVKIDGDALNLQGGHEEALGTGSSMQYTDSGRKWTPELFIHSAVVQSKSL